MLDVILGGKVLFNYYEIMRIIKRQIICVVGEQFVAYHKGSLFVSSNLKRFTKICDIPLSVKQRLFASFSLSARLFRLYPRAVCVLDKESFIFGFSGRIFNVNIFQKTINVEHVFPAPMKTPLSFTKIKGVNGFDDCIVYGEYHANPAKRDMGVYARKHGVWERVCSFRADQILHIHGFCVDKNNDRVLILTGDTDKESGMYEAKNNFLDIKPLVSGNQKYRSCVAFADGDSIIYATDTPLESNAIFRLNSNGSIDKLYDMPGPSIFGTIVEQNGKKQFVFSTSVEPDSRIKGRKYWITNKLGQGVKERYSHIIVGNSQNGFKTIMRLKKDRLPMTLFQFGNASFTEGESDHLFILPQSISGFNDKTIIF